MRFRVVNLLVGVLAIISVYWYVVRYRIDGEASPRAWAGVSRNYTTSFPKSEPVIVERGNWINGKVAGLDWSDVTTVPGLALGTDSGKHKYADSTALLTGSWGPEQTVEAVVHSVDQRDTFYEEVELRLRSSLSPHWATGYEINFRCLKTAKAYAQIVRWNGRLGDFTYLKTAEGARYGVTDGDIVRATVRGDTLTAYINGVEVLRAFDRTYKHGSPGVGFYLEGGSGVNRDFGFKKFTATDVLAAESGPTSGRTGWGSWAEPGYRSGWFPVLGVLGHCPGEFVNRMELRN